ncbi:MAG: hypothetical protein WC570_03795 [Patescibacteria group bacterium]
MDSVCSQCSVQFQIPDSDREFLDKMAPTFDNKKYPIPVPTLCPQCRQRRRLAFRNDWCLYKRKSDKSGKEILSIFSPDKPYKVYGLHEWWADDWEATQYGREYDFNRDFFQQWKELQMVVPRLALYVDEASENCDFCNQITMSKDCYMAFGSTSNERCYYGSRMNYSKDCMDCLFAMKSEGCYQCVDVFSCYNLRYGQNCSNCADSWFLYNCRGCQDCLFCLNLQNKSHCIFNEQYTKEEYEKKKAELRLYLWSNIEKYRQQFAEWVKKFPHRFAQLIGTENVTGDNVENAKDCRAVFDGNNLENVSYAMFVNDTRDSRDVNYACDGTEWNYEVCTTGVSASHVLFSLDIWPNVANLYYCDSCSNGTRDCFGCIGLRGKQYCILNKQYSKEEYEKLVGKIIEQMTMAGEWGEFFPIGLSPFGYNESLGDDFMPMTKEGASKIGANWLDKDYGLKYDGPFYEPHEDVRKYNPAFATATAGKASEEIDKALQGIIKCEVTGRPFRLISQEVRFCIRHGVPLPRVIPRQRHQDRLAMRNKRVLYSRQCMCEEKGSGNKDQGSSGGCTHEGRCGNHFETTFTPAGAKAMAGEAGVKVYCEQCYQKLIL